MGGFFERVFFFKVYLLASFLFIFSTWKLVQKRFNDLIYFWCFPFFKYNSPTVLYIYDTSNTPYTRYTVIRINNRTINHNIIFNCCLNTAENPWGLRKQFVVIIKTCLPEVLIGFQTSNAKMPTMLSSDSIIFIKCSLRQVRAVLRHPWDATTDQECGSLRPDVVQSDGVSAD